MSWPGPHENVNPKSDLLDEEKIAAAFAWAEAESRADSSDCLAPDQDAMQSTMDEQQRDALLQWARQLLKVA